MGKDRGIEKTRDENIKSCLLESDDQSRELFGLLYFFERKEMRQETLVGDDGDASGRVHNYARPG